MRKPASLVGTFIRQRRESLGFSQRQLGLRFQPPVTTQFISNLERGVTPLPPHHVATLAQELGIASHEILTLLEREYAQRISDQILSSPELQSTANAGRAMLKNVLVEEKDAEFMRSIYQAYSLADETTRQHFASLCETLLRMTK
ncbi:MAG: Helix-turn-helix domain [Pseudomonadota bacterium]